MNNFNVFLWLTFLLTMFTACTKESPTLDTSPNLVWRSSININGYVGSIAPIVYEDVVVYSRNTFSSIEPLLAFNRHTGKKLWEWTDFLGDVDQFWTGDSYQHKDILILGGPRVYAINILTGKTLWSSWDFKSSGNSQVTGIGSSIFHIKYSKTFPNISTIRYRDIYSGDWQTILEVAWGDGFDSYVGGITPYIDEFGDTLLIFTEGSYNFDEKVGGRKLWVYNLTQRKTIHEILYHPLDILPNGSVLRPIVYEGKIYTNSGKALYCFDLESGEQCWKQTFREIPSQVMMADGILLVNNNDLSLYALNPEFGSRIWKTPTGGFCSKMHLVDGVVYYTNSSNGKMYAVRVADGEVLWDYENPDRQQDNGAFFGAAMTVSPDGKYIYAYNFLDALCFETLKQ